MDFFNDIFHNLALLEFYFLNIIYILLYIDFILSIFFQHSNILTRASHHWCLASNIVLVIWWCTTNFRSHSKQNFCLANPKLPRLLLAAGPWYSQRAACIAPSFMTMAGPATGGCQGVAKPECRGPCQNSAKGSCLPWISTNGSLQLWERYDNTMTEASA